MEPERERRGKEAAQTRTKADPHEAQLALPIHATPVFLDLRISGPGAAGWTRVLNEERLPTPQTGNEDARSIIVAPLTVETLEKAHKDETNVWILEAKNASCPEEGFGFRLPPLTTAQSLPVSKFGRAVIIQAPCSAHVLRENNETVNESLDALRQALRLAHEILDIPYVHLWYYPDVSPTGFFFRVDVDFVVPGALEKFHELTERYGIKGTYFINVSGEEEYEDEIGQGMLLRPTTPDRLTELRAIQSSGNEIANHGYWHDVFPTEAENASNIARGQEELSRCFGGKCTGFAAPGAESTTALGAALKQFQFSYVANTLADNGAFPYKPHADAGFYEMPGCSLSDLCLEGVEKEQDRQGVTEDVEQFYRSMIGAHLESGLPVSLIVHPHLAGTRAEAFLEPIFKVLKEHGITSFTHAEFASWWARRAETSFEVVTDPSGRKALQCGLRDAVVEVIYKGERQLVRL